MDEEKLAKELEVYRSLSEQDKSVDVAALALAAIQSHQANLLSDKEKRWAYLISLVVPPLGLIFAIKFYFSGRDDGRQAAWFIMALTAVAILLAILFVKVLSGGMGASQTLIQ